MSQLLGFATARKTSRGNLLAGWLDGGKIETYDGTKPTNADTAITTQHLLVTFAIPYPSGSVSNGVFTGNLPDAAQIATGGTAAWARIYDEYDVVICDVDAGVSGSCNFLELDSITLVQGGYVSVTSFSIAEG